MMTLILFTTLLMLDIAVVSFLIGWACCARQMLTKGAMPPTVSTIPSR